MTDRFHISTTNGVASIVFDDGGMNLLSTSALRELSVAIRAVERSIPSLLVFRSGHLSVFAAGADMQEMQHFTAPEASDFAELGQELFARIERLSCVTVTSIDGDCFGGALDLALAFDVRLASPRARFSHPGARLGIVTGFGGTSRWSAVLDRGRAARFFLDNAIFDAGAALDAGLVSAIVDPHQERALIESMARKNSRRGRFLKELSIRGANLSYDALHRIAPRLAQLHLGAGAG